MTQRSLEAFPSIWVSMEVLDPQRSGLEFLKELAYEFVILTKGLLEKTKPTLGLLAHDIAE